MRIDCEVAVVGGGISGMIAALRAAQGGKRVRVLERSSEDRYVCNSRITGGIWHCCQMDVRLEPEVLESRIMEITGGNARPDLARAVARDGLRVIRWMQSVGIRFISGPYDYQAFMLAPPTITPRGRQWEGRGGDVMLRRFEEGLREHDGEVLRGHTAERLSSEGGRVSGVAGTRADGRAFEVRADTVVLADGGFHTSPEHLRGSITSHPEKLLQRNAGTGLGLGLEMARSAGAGTSDLRGFYGHVQSRDAMKNDRLWPYAWLDFVLAAGIVVTSEGRRFDDEGLGGVHMANAIASLDDPLDAIVLADQTIWDERGKFNLLPPNPRLPEAGGTVHQADDLSTLAERAGIASEVLLGEVARYNEAIRARSGQTLAPPRTADRFEPYPIEKPPFYAFPACAGITYAMGGISIDSSCRVLDPDDRPIPGLYAVGCTTGGLEGGDKKGYVGGLVISSVTGLRAAEHILGTPEP